MSVELAVRDRLRGDAAVTALVSTRVWMAHLPQRPVLPALCVQLIDEPEDQHLRGADGLTRARVQLDAYDSEVTSADAYQSVVDIAAAVHGALSGIPWTDGSSPPETLVILAQRESRRTLPVPEELRLIRLSMDYFVWSKAA